MPQVATFDGRISLLLALGAVLAFAWVEWLVGTSIGSFALVAESGHMLADSLGLGLAVVAAWAAPRTPARPADLSDLADRSIAHSAQGWIGSPMSGIAHRSLVDIVQADSLSPQPPPSTEIAPSASPHRLEAWAALINGVGLGGLALLIGWEALLHLSAPPTEIASWPMLVTAVVGLGVNGLNLKLLHGGAQHSLNIRAAFLHVLGDALSCGGVIVAALAVALLHCLWADGLVGLLVSGVIAGNAWPVVRQSWRQLRP
jgi:cobalt-zinc-cadmium efflux system protein